MDVFLVHIKEMILMNCSRHITDIPKSDKYSVISFVPLKPESFLIQFDFF